MESWQSFYVGRKQVPQSCLSSLLPAALCIGQNRRAGGEQWPLSEAPGENESKSERALVPAVNVSSVHNPGWQMESMVSWACLRSRPWIAAMSPASESVQGALGSHMLPSRPSHRPGSHQMPLTADPELGWGHHSKSAGHLTSTPGPRELCVPRRGSLATPLNTAIKVKIKMRLEFSFHVSC